MGVSIDRLLIDNMTSAVAFFSEDGFLSRNSLSWEALCNTPEIACTVLFYDDFIGCMNLCPLLEGQVHDISEVVRGSKTIRITRKQIRSLSISGISVEMEDITTANINAIQADRILSDAIWKIKSRIAGIQNVLTLFTEFRADQFDEQSLRLLVKCNREIWELERQAENLRYLMQIDIGYVNYLPVAEHFRLREFVKDILLRIEPLIRSFPVTPVIKVNIDSELHVATDRQILQKIISSILFNALVYNDLKAPVEISALSAQGSIFISIEDQGWGIPPEEQEHIFSYTYRGARAKKSGYSGLGVELYLARRLATLVSAVIEFISKDGKGSRFQIILEDSGKPVHGQME